MSARCVHYCLSVTVSRFSRGAEVENLCDIYTRVCIYICIDIHTQTFVFCLLLYLCVLNHLFKPVSPVIIQQRRIYSGLLPLYVLNSLICLSIRKLVPIILSLLTHLLKTPLPNQYVNKVLGHRALSPSPGHSDQNLVLSKEKRPLLKVSSERYL